MVFIFMALALAPAGAVDPAAHRREIEAWQQARDVRLRADGGWLTLAGLFWLKPGANRFGADAQNDIVLPAHAAPAQAGVFTLDGARKIVTVEAAAGVAVTLGGQPVTRTALRSDAAGAEPDVLALGPLTMQVIDRQGHLGIRLKDSQSQTRREFTGLHYYPIDARYRVVARFVAHPRPVRITIPNALGFPETEPSPGYAEFELGGRTLRLDAVTETPGDRQLFFIFRDGTAGRTTYGSGRFLYADPPEKTGGPLILDFNKAYTPPCAFTPYATCPLPPAQNRLPVSIEAGELFAPHRP
jgi:uncharacterized protein (DUF1684 family)